MPLALRDLIGLGEGKEHNSNVTCRSRSAVLYR